MNKPLFPEAWQTPVTFRERLGSKVGRQRAMFADGHLLLVLHAPPTPDESNRVGRFFWRSPEGTWASNAFGTGFNSLSKHLDEYEEAISGLDRSEMEAATANDYLDVLEQLGPLRRSIGNLHQVLQESRKAYPEYRELIDARDRAYEIERTADLLLSGTKNALDVLAARQAELQAASSHQMALASHRLNLLVAFFFPIATLTAIFGTNLQHGLEQLSPPYPFLAVLVLGLVLGAILTAFVTWTSGRK